MNFEKMQLTINELGRLNEQIKRVEHFIKNNFNGYKEAKTHISMSDRDGSYYLGFFIEYSKIKPFIIEYLEEMKDRANELKSELGIEDWQMIANIIIIACVALMILGMFLNVYEIGKPREPITAGSAICNNVLIIIFLIALYFKLK